jgi:collagen type I/II/III/V/XI/XXIV/XXVII alpha
VFDRFEHHREHGDRGKRGRERYRDGGVRGSALSAVDVAGTVDATGSSISSNVAMGGSGGSDDIAGSFESGEGGQTGAAITAAGVSLTATSVSGNVATGGDGGLASGPAAPGGPGGIAFGGGIEAGNQLTITSSIVSGNRATAGNGGAATGAGGTGGAAGGALGAAAAFLSPSGVVGITDSTISGNISSGGVPGVGSAQAAPSGGSVGALSVTRGQVEISGSTISGNEAVGAGGAIGALGGGLYLSQTAATIVNSTVFGNTEQAGPAGTPVIEGGGIYASVGAFVLLSSDTIAGNTAAPATLHPLGANLYGDDTATYTLQDTAIAAPLPAGVANCSFGEASTDDGHNLGDSSASTCGLTAAGGDQIGSPAGLPPALGANGGTAVAATSLSPAIPATMTLAPASGSPLLGNGGSCTDPLAINAATAPFPPLTVDERGDPRPATCDIGAYQSQPLTASGAPSIPSTATVGESLTCASGTFATSGDGALTASGAVGAPVLTYTWASTGIQVATGQTYVVGAGDAGHTLTCTETATGAYGHGSATSSGALVPAPASSTGATAPTGAGGTTGTTKTTGTSATHKLAIGAVAQAHTRWTLTRSKGLPVGTSFAYTLTKKAKVTLTFTT